MKCYIVFKDNGERYEDYAEFVDKVFLNKEKATKYISCQKDKKENKEKRFRYAIEFRIEEHEVKE